VDPGTDAVAATIPAGDGPDALAIAGDSVRAADRLASALTRIRVTNYQYNPFLGVLLDQLRIRPTPSPR
jgi:hypothetical protein